MTARIQSLFGKILTAAALLMLAMLAGCDMVAPTPPVVPQQAVARIDEAAAEPDVPAARPVAGPELPRTKASEMEPLAEPDDGGKLVEEIWDAYSLQGSRVGYAHTTVVNVEEGGETLVRTRGATRTPLKRAGQTSVQDMLLTSWEKPGGELVRFESRMKMGPTDMVSQGRVQGDKFVIDTLTLGKTQTQTISWPA